ncbi:helix-turn-helix domain-containing protein [Bacillus sp. 1P06AnD]|uniref:helix-turn-helix domain-containing protein n=1 Tax=Bacillus sp. 1P06AnD TaxID=3132208 RepID=UPI0039A337DC
MKKKITVIAGETAYTNLSTFKSVEEMNQTVRTYRDNIQELVKRADVQSRLISLLEVLKRHSCKQIGVSYMCKNTIASLLEVSYKTVQRLMKKLEAMAMIRQVPTKRKKDMRQTANAIQILPSTEVTDKTPGKKSDKCPTNKTTSVSLKQKIKNIRKVDDTPSSTVDENVDNQSEPVFYDHTYVSSSIPKSFIDAVSPFFRSASSIYRLWGRLCLAARKSNANIQFDLHMDTWNKTFKEAIYQIKKGNVKGDVIGYIYGAWKNAMFDTAVKLNPNKRYNWLEA